MPTGTMMNVFLLGESIGYFHRDSFIQDVSWLAVAGLLGTRKKDLPKNMLVTGTYFAGEYGDSCISPSPNQVKGLAVAFTNKIRYAQK